MSVQVADNLKPMNNSTEFPVAFGEDVWLDKNKGSGTPNYESIQNMFNNDDLGGGETIQVDTMPLASAEYEGQILEYVGASGTYTNGYFYECVSDGEATPTYSWVQKNVQPSNATASDVSYDNTTSELDATNVQDAIDEVVSGLGTASGKDFTDEVRPNSHDLVESIAVYSAINNALNTIYTPRGDLSCSQLTSALLIADNVGNVYQMSDTGYTSSLFINGAGITINKDDNVGIIKAGANEILFNYMGSAFDLHDYQKKDLTTAVEGQATVEGALGLLEYKSGTFSGTLDEWDALTPTEQAKYDFIATPDEAVEDIADAVIDGDMRAVTSNAVAKTLCANNAGAHNGIYRGKYLGSSVTAEQYAQISAGTFKDLFIGDYWTIGGVNYRIAAFDYWLHTGATTKCTTHHVVLVPDTHLYTAVMNSSDVTTGGYANSAMYTSNLADAKTTINNAFGSTHILNHEELLTFSVTDGKADNMQWYNSTIELMNECMVYGHISFGSHAGYETGADKTQLPLFAMAPEHIPNNSANCWLRTVASSTSFTDVSRDGHATQHPATSDFGVRPAFAIIG